MEIKSTSSFEELESHLNEIVNFYSQKIIDLNHSNDSKASKADEVNRIIPEVRAALENATSLMKEASISPVIVGITTTTYESIRKHLLCIDYQHQFHQRNNALIVSMLDFSCS